MVYDSRAPSPPEGLKFLCAWCYNHQNSKGLSCQILARMVQLTVKRADYDR